MKTTVKSTVFQSFAKSGNGGVFEVYGISLAVECCSFLSDHVASSGGCIYASECNVEIYRTSFEKCYTSAHTDEVSGNAVYVNKNKIVIDMVSTYQCGPASDLCSDSSIRASSVFAKVSNVNATDNYGFMGSSVIGLDSAIIDSSVRYSQDVSGRDYTSMHSVDKHYYVYNSNFINQTSHSCVCWSSKDYLLSFESCVFWNFGGITFCNCACNFKTCVSNGDVSGVTKTDVYSVNIIVFKKCRAAGTKMRCSNNFVHYNIFMIFLIVS